jgi:DNA-binding GntR family transcriptional regulator
VTLAVRKASLDDVARLRHISEEGRAAAAAEDYPRAQAANARFHRELSALARHTILSEFLEDLDRKVHWIFSNVRVERFAEHDDIIDALENRDPDAARAATLDHIEQTHSLLKAKMRG